MRRWLLVAAAVFVLLLVSPASPCPSSTPRRCARRSSSARVEALGRDVSLGKISLRIFPLPAVRIDDVRIAGVKPSDTPLAQIA